jgi:hypothetical protein
MSMIRSSIGRRTTDGTTAAAALEIIAGAKGCFIKELLISMAAATASTFGIGRPAALGVTPTSPVTSLVEAGGDSPATVKTAVAWGTGPTVPAAFFRRVSLQNVIGSLQVFKFTGGNGLYIPPNASIVVWNLATNGVADVIVVADEQQ